MRQSKSKDYCSNNLTSFEESELDFLPSQFGLLQIIKEPTHTQKLKTLQRLHIYISTKYDNWFWFGVHASLYSNCHHKII